MFYTQISVAALTLIVTVFYLGEHLCIQATYSLGIEIVSPLLVRVGIDLDFRNLNE